MVEDSSVLLLTGATGLVGSGLLTQFSGKRRRFILLSREPQTLATLSRANGSTMLKGDVTRPHLGLNDRTYAELKCSITEIIHCAADTRFGISLNSARETNTAGTREVLDLAFQCARLQKLAYISTVYVVGRSAGYFPEDRIIHQNGFCNSYQQSKYEAEQLVVATMGDLPAAI